MILYCSKNIRFKKKIKLNSDKSISHRAIFFASLAKGTSYIKNLTLSNDIIETINALKNFDVKFQKIKSNTYKITSCGYENFNKPKKPIKIKQSNTTLSLILGLTCGLKFKTEIKLSNRLLYKRDLQYKLKALKKINAKYKIIKNKLIIYPSKLKNLKFETKIFSAQLKTILIIAAILAKKNLIFIEKYKTRDHTERFLKFLGFNIKCKKKQIIIKKQQRYYFKPFNYTIPFDISNASFFILYATLKYKEIILKNLLINKTRTGYIDILNKMGANITIKKTKDFFNEPIGNIIIKKSKNLYSINLKNKKLIYRAVDEIPLIILACSLAKGTSTIKNIEFLKLKESDRIKAITNNLKKLKINIHTYNNIVKISNQTNKKNIKRIILSSYNDHRIVMAIITLLAIFKKEAYIRGFDAIKKSFPDFLRNVKGIKICKKIHEK